MLLTRRRLLLTKKSGGLPSEYQEVEWISSDGNGKYINSLFIPNNYDYPNISVDFIIYKEAGKEEFVFGVMPTNGSRLNQFTFGCLGSRDDIYYCFNDYDGFVDSIRHGVRLLVNCGTRSNIGDYLTIDGTSYLEQSPSPSKSIYPIYLFARNNVSSAGSYAKARLYKVSFYNDNTLIKNFIPCYRKSDGVIGLYDLEGSICPLTNSPFYINAGTGTFEKGPDVN